MIGVGLSLWSMQAPSPSPTVAEVVTSLFAGGEQGYLFDLADFATLFQDLAGTTPVTAVGQPVGKMLDISGRGNHFTQATAASRPILQQDAAGHYYLAVDGVDDWMSAIINFTASNKLYLCVAIRKMVDTQAVIVDHGTTSSGVGMFGLGCTSNILWNGRSTLGATGTAGITASNITYIGAASLVISAMLDYTAAAGSEFSMRIQGVSKVQTVGLTQENTGTLGLQTCHLFRRAGTTLPFNGRFYGGLARAGAITAAQVAMVERFMSDRIGA